MSAWGLSTKWWLVQLNGCHHWIQGPRKALLGKALQWYLFGCVQFTTIFWVKKVTYQHRNTSTFNTLKYTIIDSLVLAIRGNLIYCFDAHVCRGLSSCNLLCACSVNFSPEMQLCVWRPVHVNSTANLINLVTGRLFYDTKCQEMRKAF